MPGIIVGIDGSQHLHFALEPAMQYAAGRHLPLTVITVVEQVAVTGSIVANTGASVISTSSWTKAAAACRSTGTSSGQRTRNCQTSKMSGRYRI